MTPFNTFGPSKKKNKDNWEDAIDWDEVLEDEKRSRDSDYDDYSDY